MTKPPEKLVNIIKICRSFLKYDEYTLTTNIGTKAASPFKKSLNSKLFEPNETFY
jgi:hypothetical protein